MIRKLLAPAAMAAFSAAVAVPVFAQPPVAPDPSCKLTTPAAGHSSSGVVTSLTDTGNAPKAGQGGVEPAYADVQRVQITLGGGGLVIAAVPKGMTVQVGDKVNYMSAYRSKTQPCSYVPAAVTDDLGRADDHKGANNTSLGNANGQGALKGRTIGPK